MELQGAKCASNKTDVWAANLTMMKILVGDDAIKSAIKYVSNMYTPVLCGIYLTYNIIGYS